MISSGNFAPTQNTNGFIIGSNPKLNKWSTVLGGLVFRQYPLILNVVPDVAKQIKDTTDYELKKKGKDMSYILTRKEPVYRGIKTPEEAQKVYGGSGNYIIGQDLV
jgi:hypothetical protein